jgi:hypothetical protein
MASPGSQGGWFYRLVVWELGEDPSAYVARIETQIDLEIARQAVCRARGIPVPDVDHDRLHQAQEQVFRIKRTVLHVKEKME